MRKWPAVLLVCLASLASCVAATAKTSANPAGSSPVTKDEQFAPDFQNTTTLVWSGGKHWQLFVENTNKTRLINVFNWAPPSGLTVTAITSSAGANCGLSVGSIKCRTNIAPKQSLEIDFAGDGFESKYVDTDYGGYWNSNGWGSGVINVTVTSLPPDLPRCAKGHPSTKAKPCSKT
jgi:hypothetical protein